MRNQSIKTVVVGSLIGMLAYASATYADHSWSTYHWARMENPIPLLVVDSVSPDWQFELDTALGEWNYDLSVLNMSIDSADDSSRTRKRCSMKSGQIRVCNAAYGFNGWLGMASIGIQNGHIVQGSAKVNDSYSSYWLDSNEKRHVMCQEIGHLFGLGHTSEDGSSQGTCMDYSSAPASISPNGHDYAMLVEIYYSHLDSYNSYDEGATTTGVCSAPPGKGCNKNSGAGVGPGSDGPPPMGVRVHKDKHEEIWVAPRSDGGLWIHHVRLVPD